MSEDVSESIHEIVQELRVIIPGTQALLGFQFVAFFSTGYRMLEPPQRYMHLANLLAIVAATGFLMAPVTLHQLGERGHDSPSVLRSTRRLLLTGMTLLALGLSGDTFVAADITIHSDWISAAVAFIALAFLTGLWFGRHTLLPHTRGADQSPPPPVD